MIAGDGRFPDRGLYVAAGGGVDPIATEPEVELAEVVHGAVEGVGLAGHESARGTVVGHEAEVVARIRISELVVEGHSDRLDQVGVETTNSEVVSVVLSIGIDVFEETALGVFFIAIDLEVVRGVRLGISGSFGTAGRVVPKTATDLGHQKFEVEGDGLVGRSVGGAVSGSLGQLGESSDSIFGLWVVGDDVGS